MKKAKTFLIEVTVEGIALAVRAILFLKSTRKHLEWLGIV